METEHLSISSKTDKEGNTALTANELKEAFAELIGRTRRSVKDNEIEQCFKDAMKEWEL